ncbi:MAG: hypothetical protein J7K26_02170 [Candidatus Aenigmarchaeota archaeon]|nr:hypothetical protein [Candidatus Aenigmarchaeota archaeon]
MKENLLKFINRTGGIKCASKFLNTSPNNIYRWLRGERAYPYSLCIEIAKKMNMNIWKMLNNEQIKSMTSNNYCRIRQRISEEEFNILAWILADGNMGGKNNDITISQQNRKALEKLAILIENNFQTNNITHFNRDRSNWKLDIANRGIKYYFNLRYNIPLDRKCNKIRVPLKLYNSSKNAKLAFLAVSIEADGTFSFYRRIKKSGKMYIVPRVTFASNSLEFLKRCTNIT